MRGRILSMSKKKSLQSSLFTALKFTIGWPISIIALFFIARIIFPHSQTIINNLGNINKLLLILSIVSFILYYFVRSFIWKLILKEQGYDIPLKSASFLWAISELKRFVPGNIWSFIGRASLFRELGVPAKTILKAILIEIQFLLLGSLMISTFSIPFVLKNIITVIPNHPLTIAFGILLVSLTILAFIFATPIIDFIQFKPLYTVKRILPNSSPKTKVTLLFISSIYSFFFALGSFFAATSIVYVSPDLIFQVIGFFSLSFLAGYLSLVTPMGIGVREGIITVGLSKVLPLIMSGFISILARVLLIFSELLFLLLAFLWKNIKNKYVFALENFINNHKHEVVLAILVFLYISYFTTASFLRYDNFYAGRFDLGNMDQTVWNTINGRIFELTDPNGTNIISRLAIHADFILILLSPFYLLWESPKMLLLIQTVILALGTGFVYAIAKKAIKNKNLALTFGVLFLLNPALQFTNLYDFHGVTLSTTFLLGSFYFLMKKKYLPLLIFSILAGLTKEHVWLITALFGFYIFFSKKRFFGIIIFAMSIFLFYYLIWHAIPNALGNKHFALSYYSEFGDSPTQIVKNIFLSPQKTLSVVTQKDQLIYLKNLFLPVGFIPIFAFPFMIFSIPDLFINLLSKNPNLHQIYYQYSASITPFILISTIFGVKNLKKWFPKIPNAIFICYLVFFTLVSTYHYGPLPGAKKPNIAMFTRQLPEAKYIDNFLSTIPPKYSIAATNNVGSHLSHRQKIYTIPVGIDKADYIVFLLNDLSAQPSLEFQKDLANKLSLYKDYVEVFRNGDFVAFKKANL